MAQVPRQELCLVLKSFNEDLHWRSLRLGPSFIHVWETGPKCFFFRAASTVSPEGQREAADSWIWIAQGSGESLRSPWLRSCDCSTVSSSLHPNIVLIQVCLIYHQSALSGLFYWPHSTVWHKSTVPHVFLKSDSPTVWPSCVWATECMLVLAKSKEGTSSGTFTIWNQMVKV